MPRGNQCVCPGNQQENANGVCVPPAAVQLKCVKGHVPRGNQCVCPGKQQENANGVCVPPAAVQLKCDQGTCAARQPVRLPGETTGERQRRLCAAGGRAAEVR